MLVDCIFLTEISYNFFVGVFLQGQYYDDMKTVAKTYMMGGFWFDMLTSIPVSVVELLAQQSCISVTNDPYATETESQMDTSNLRF